MTRKLDAYRQKRNFEGTPEPPPGKTRSVRPKGALTFMVHKHDATRLHYDLRLEMGDALASWAVPKGPSYDPKERHLAVETEDHPLEYGKFEGRIPHGQYGAGDSMIWDRGTYETVPPGQELSMKRKGHILFELHGEKLKGKWHLVRTRLVPGSSPQWLLFKSSRDEYARADYDVVAERPESVVSGRRRTRGPLRARVLREHRLSPEELLRRTSPTRPAKGRAVAAHARKGAAPAGGIRLAVSLGAMAIDPESTRARGEKVKPELAKACSELEVAEAVLTGRVTSGGKRFEADDLLWLDGEDLRRYSAAERRDLLESVVANATSITASPARTGKSSARSHSGKRAG